MAEPETSDRVATSWPTPAGALEPGPVGVAALFAAVATLLGWRGADLPAQLLRTHLFEVNGFTPWNGQWFGGHATAGYSVLFPAVAAVVGAGAVGVLSAVAAGACAATVARLRGDHRSRVAAQWFAAGTVANLAVGRLTFAFGLALACGALAALVHRRTAVAIGAATLAPLASPVAGVGLIVVAAAAVLGIGPSRAAARPWLALGAAGAVPIVGLAVLFPSSSSGSFPFTAASLLLNLGVAAVVWWATPSSTRCVRAGALVYGLACLAVAAVPNPLGGNISRIGMHAAGPLLVAVVVGPRRRLLLLLVPVLVGWQWSPALDAVLRAGRDPSTAVSYHQPLVDVIVGAGIVGRIEVVPTRRHWETYYVAGEVPLARGWERQTDRAQNPEFYDGSLTAASFHRWLLDNDVVWVALPDVALDDAGRAEAALLASPPPYLRLAWTDEHWQLWKVIGPGAGEAVVGPARLLGWDQTSVSLAVTGPGSVVVRVRDSPHWHLVGGRAATGACLREAAGGWVQVDAAGAGRLELVQAIIGPPSRC